MRDRHLRSLFADDPLRGQRFVAEGAGLYLDYSKNRITDETIRLLVGLADACSLRERINAMFSGEKINTTEQRAVLHVALRAPLGAAIVLDGDNVVPRVHDVLDRRVRRGKEAKLNAGRVLGEEREVHARSVPRRPQRRRTPRPDTHSEILRAAKYARQEPRSAVEKNREVLVEKS